MFCAQSKERINMYTITIILQFPAAVHKDSTTMKIWGLYLKKTKTWRSLSKEWLDMEENMISGAIKNETIRGSLGI